MLIRYTIQNSSELFSPHINTCVIEFCNPVQEMTPFDAILMQTFLPSLPALFFVYCLHIFLKTIPGFCCSEASSCFSGAAVEDCV